MPSEGQNIALHASPTAWHFLQGNFCASSNFFFPPPSHHQTCSIYERLIFVIWFIHKMPWYLWESWRWSHIFISKQLLMIFFLMHLFAFKFRTLLITFVRFYFEVVVLVLLFLTLWSTGMAEPQWWKWMTFIWVNGCWCDIFLFCCMCCGWLSSSRPGKTVRSFLILLLPRLGVVLLSCLFEQLLAR